MKVIILAGGYGTRLSEYTDTIPKPMVPIGNIPMLVHIMKIYAKFNHKNFYIALGYKGEVIKKYFEDNKYDWKINLIDTGADTLTGGRIKRLKSHIGNETFLLTYGDGLSDLNIERLIDFHKSHGKMITVTAVRPLARFGALKLNGDLVSSFKEKSQLQEGWINGGFFVIDPSFFDFLENDKTILEKGPLEAAAKQKQLMAFKHEGFWQCMDHKVDKDSLEQMVIKKNAPWLD